MKSSIKTLYKTVAVVALLTGLAVASRAQVVIGSWQSAPIPPSPANDEGWFRASGGLGNLGSIFASSNMPVNFDLVTNVAAGYAQSLVVHEYGYGNIRLAVSLNASQIAAFTNNNKFNFTFSVQPGSAQYSAGYIQMVQFQYNSSGGGFHAITPSTSAGFSETGDTANNSSGQPIFYYYSSAPARQQVVTWDYSSAKTNMVGSSYVQFVFVFQVGGGAPTNIYINNVTLSGAEIPTIIIDQFNPTNNPYAGTNVYALGQITNIYANWFGSAFSNVVWDASNDAQSNTNSGSLEITANFGTNGGDQFVVMDKGPGFSYVGINPPITNGIGLLTFQCDVRYDTNSPTWITGGGTNYGNLQFGVIPPYTSQDVFGAVTISVTNTGWVHVTLPLNAVTDPNLISFSGIFIKMDGASYGNLQGTTTLWVDNLEITYTNITVVPLPVMDIQKASPSLRIFAGDTSSQYSREEVATVDQNQSWIGGTYPVTYSFTLLSPPGGIGQTHIFLVPVNSTPGANPYGYNGLDYTATNGLWLTLNPGPSAGTMVATVSWKTNLPNANPYAAGGNIALVYTNTGVVGTWTLAFSNNNSGAVIGPGGTPHAFTITNGTVATDFANPVVAYFGLQPNSTAAEGQYEDWASITVTGVAGTKENEDFTQETSQDITASGYWRNMAAKTNSLAIVPNNTLPAYWLNWTLPATGYDVGTGTNLLAPGSDNTPGGWMLPEYYNDYNTGTTSLPGEAQQGTKIWVLVPSTCLPTLNGQPFGPLAPNGYFRLFNLPLAN
jgi:hypothetical protein